MSKPGEWPLSSTITRVKGCYWCLGMEGQIAEKSKVDLVGSYDPGPVGGKGLKKGVKPADLILR